MPFRWISDFYQVLQRRTAPLHVPVLSTTSVVRRFENVSIMFVFRIRELTALNSCSALGAAPHRTNMVGAKRAERLVRTPPWAPKTAGDISDHFQSLAFELYPLTRLAREASPARCPTEQPRAHRWWYSVHGRWRRSNRSSMQVNRVGVA